MKIEDPNNVIPGFILIMVLPYLLLGLMIYLKFKPFYKKHIIIYFIILFFVLLYVLLASFYIYEMSIYPTGLDSVKISL